MECFVWNTINENKGSTTKLTEPNYLRNQPVLIGSVSTDETNVTVDRRRKVNLSGNDRTLG